MAVISMPATPAPVRLRWTAPSPATQVNRSGWTGHQKALIVSHATRWRVAAEFPPIYLPAVYLPWRSFFVQLQGQANTFYLPACAQQHSLAEPRINGTPQMGDDTVPVDGMTPNADYFVPGHLVTIPLTSGVRQLVVVRSPLTASGTGAGNIVFDPPLRGDVTNNTLLETTNPYAELSLVDDAPGWDAGPGGEHGFAFEAEEAY